MDGMDGLNPLCSYQVGSYQALTNNSPTHASNPESIANINRQMAMLNQQFQQLQLQAQELLSQAEQSLFQAKAIPQLRDDDHSADIAHIAHIHVARQELELKQPKEETLESNPAVKPSVITCPVPYDSYTSSAQDQKRKQAMINAFQEGISKKAAYILEVDYLYDDLYDDLYDENNSISVFYVMPNEDINERIKHCTMVDCDCELLNVFSLDKPLEEQIQEKESEQAIGYALIKVIS